MRRAALCLAGVAVLATSVLPAGATPPTYTPGTVVGTDCPLFPADNWWRARVDRLPVAARSADWVRTIGVGQRLHPDFGPSYGEQSVPYGIGVTVVGGGHRRVGVRFDYASESDRVPYPLGADTFIEGGRESDGDRHAIVVDRDSCRLYETWDTHPGSPRWHAGSGATWDLRSNALRPNGWTSADAAGLPILPGLLTYDEVRAGRVAHAIRFTAPVTRRAHVWPARHDAGSTDSRSAPPMGARFRLAGSFDLTGWSRDAQVILRGMKRYGMVLADNGSPWFFQGTADSRWPEALIDELKRVPARAFRAVDTSSLRVSRDSAATVPRRDGLSGSEVRRGTPT
ncbi:MAG: hypothetical protein U0R64_04445 [Candidatus Nanopelagicales bacterium]